MSQFAKSMALMSNCKALLILIEQKRKRKYIKIVDSSALWTMQENCTNQELTKISMRVGYVIREFTDCIIGWDYLLVWEYYTMQNYIISESNKVWAYNFWKWFVLIVPLNFNETKQIHDRKVINEVPWI